MSSGNEPSPLVSQILKLPRIHQQIVAEDYIDANGHMNMMYYTLIGNLGMRNFMEKLGLHQDLFRSKQRGIFALRQVMSFVNELREGEEIAVHSGLVGYDSKRFHFMHYIVSLSSGKLASTDERLAMYIDLTIRRSTTFEPDVMEKLALTQVECEATGWKPELSGAIKIKHKREEVPFQ